MVSLRALTQVAVVLGVATAFPADISARQTWVPGAQNNTQEFYIKLVATEGPTPYDCWTIETYHTGAGLADPVFVPTPTSRAFLNGTNLQFDVDPYPFSLNANPGDTNYARWEPITIASGYGSGSFFINGREGIQVDNPEFGGWLVCEWYHGDNAPQLFQLISGFNTPGLGYPATCWTANLIPEYI